MSEENVEVVQKVIDAFDRGDLDAWLDFLSPEVVWESLPLPGCTGSNSRRLALGSIRVSRPMSCCPIRALSTA